MNFAYLWILTIFQTPILRVSGDMSTRIFEVVVTQSAPRINRQLNITKSAPSTFEKKKLRQDKTRRYRATAMWFCVYTGVRNPKLLPLPRKIWVFFI